MPVNVRIDGDVAVLSNFGQLLNDPRHFDASRDVRNLLDQGHRKFVMELVGIREMGSTSMGLLVTLTRLIRQYGGEVVLARLNPATKQFIDDMQMEEYWDVFPSVAEGVESFQGPTA
jgi:anti-sigma B factor antagonist